MPILCTHLEIETNMNHHIPFFSDLPEPGIKRGYVVSHCLFLAEEERKALLNGTIITTGYFLPVFVEDGDTDEPKQEIFCHYKLITINNPEKVVLATTMGWWIHLDKSIVVRLNDCEFVAIANHDIVTINNIAYPILHQIVISDIKDLEDNMHCCHFPQTVSK